MTRGRRVERMQHYAVRRNEGEGEKDKRSAWLVGSNMDAYIGAHQVREREGVDSNRFNRERCCPSPISCQLNSTRQIEELELREVTVFYERENRSRMKVKISHTAATILSKIIETMNFYT